ncbi:ThuA domain-containing protein [Microbacterium sp.]|uniref:ThuA domain-containing protein n=1 Tax=Microbacterium sp. TaxID=51671 RepID=UPI002D788ED8|nr:ThuA domain-containing protein [Microbacterium sp.]HET6301873.1 ThuA domain-containing protein [Microbacterium sp.]
MVPNDSPNPTAVIASGGGRYSDPHHAFAVTSARIAETLTDDGWTVTVFGDPAAALVALGGADLLVMNAGPGEGGGEIDPDAASGLASALARGIGVLSVHSSLLTLRDVPFWRETIGGAWVDASSWHPDISDADIRIVDRDHPITAGADDFTLYDERYTDLVIDDPGIRVLAAHELDGVRHPLLWVREAGDSRVAVSALGHHERSYESREHRMLLARAARWAARLPGR